MSLAPTHGTLVRSIAVLGLAATALASPGARAQSKVLPNQLKGVASSNGQIYLVLPNGTVTLADIDPTTLTVDQSSGKPVLRALIPPPAPAPVQVSGEVLTADATNPLSFTPKSLANPATIRVYRNGIRQTAGVDYQLVTQSTPTGVSGQTSVVFVAYYSSSSGDLIVADYQLR